MGVLNGRRVARNISLADGVLFASFIFSALVLFGLAEVSLYGEPLVEYAMLVAVGSLIGGYALGESRSLDDFEEWEQATVVISLVLLIGIEYFEVIGEYLYADHMFGTVAVAFLAFGYALLNWK